MHSHQDLVAQGGFNRANKTFLYKHRNLHTKTAVDRRISKLRTEMQKKQKAKEEFEERLMASRSKKAMPQKEGLGKAGRSKTAATKIPRTGRAVKNVKPRKS